MSGSPTKKNLCKGCALEGSYLRCHVVWNSTLKHGYKEDGNGVPWCFHPKGTVLVLDEKEGDIDEKEGEA